MLSADGRATATERDQRKSLFDLGRGKCDVAQGYRSWLEAPGRHEGSRHSQDLRERATKGVGAGRLTELRCHQQGAVAYRVRPGRLFLGQAARGAALQQGDSARRDSK